MRIVWSGDDGLHDEDAENVKVSNDGLLTAGKGQVELSALEEDDEPNYPEIAERIALETGVILAEMPYNWTAVDVIITALSSTKVKGSGMTQESVTAMCRMDGVIESILEKFGDKLMTMDWQDMIDDAIAEVLEEEGL